MAKDDKAGLTGKGAVTLQESELDQAQGGLLPASERMIGTKKISQPLPVELMPGATQAGH